MSGRMGPGEARIRVPSAKEMPLPGKEIAVPFRIPKFCDSPTMGRDRGKAENSSPACSGIAGEIDSEKCFQSETRKRLGRELLLGAAFSPIEFLGGSDPGSEFDRIPEVGHRHFRGRDPGYRHYVRQAAQVPDPENLAGHLA